MAAYRLGMTGKKVLVIDFDLESPGLSSILLDQSRLPDLGVVDWFVADAVGQGSEVIPRMSALSGISEIQGFPGRVEVVSAYGGERANTYLNYLASPSTFRPLMVGLSGLETVHAGCSKP
jgi:hypothetical protein